MDRYMWNVEEEGGERVLGRELAKRRRAVQIDTLTEENARLKERVRVLEESDGQV